jgi:outer membrane protein OmpA-like peptidoglycan-associated protein
MSINLNKDNGDKKKFNLSKTPEAADNKIEETISSTNMVESNPKKTTKGLWIVIVALVLLGGIWFLTSKSSEEEPNSNSESNQENVSTTSGDTSTASSPVSEAVAPVADTTASATTTVSNPTADNTSDNAPISNTSNVTDNTTAEVKTEAVAPKAISNNSESKPVVKTVSVAKPKDKTHTNFAAGSANLNKISKSLVKEISDFVSKNPNAIVTINGFASSEGDLNVNQELSQKRAEKVKEYLINKGIPSSQLQAVGKGIENPIGDNNTNEGRMQNRRTEIVF